MEDDDVICLSSDEEVTESQPNKKKIKLKHEPMLRPKTEANVDSNVVISKRKIPETHIVDLFSTKKPKITGDRHIEEIIIESPRKAPSKEIEKKSDAPKCLENDSAKKATTSRTLENCAKAEILRSDTTNRLSSSKQSNDKPVTTNENDWKIPAAELSTKSQKNADGSEPSLARVVHDFFKAKDKSDNKTENIANRNNKVSSFSNKSENSQPDNLKTPSKNNIEVPNIRASGSSNLWEKISENFKNKASKIETPKDVKPNGDVHKRSKSPEVQILPSVKTPKSSTKYVLNNNAEKNSIKSANIQPRRISESSRKSPVETLKSVPNAATIKKSNSLDTQQTRESSTIVEKVLNHQPEQKTSRPMPRCRKINTAKDSAEAIPKSPNVTPASESLNAPKITNCVILSEVDEVSVPMNGIVLNTSISEKSSNLNPQNLDSKPSDVSVAVNQLIPRNVPRSPNVVDKPKVNNPETPIANGKSRQSLHSPSNSSTEYFSSRSSFGEKNSEIPENMRLANGDCSKTRKVGNKDDPISPKIVPETPEVSSNFFEPKPGCSKSPDPSYSPEKPQLVVKTIKPAYTINQDTFSKFLSLLQQTDHGSAMPKIISKLKRYYDEMDKSYARSREFEELLNEKRDKICETGKSYVYVYASHVMDEMKRRRKKRKGKKPEEADDREVPEKVEEEPAANEQNGEIEYEEEEEEDSDEARRRTRNIKKIDNAMKLIKKKIKKLEEREVDWDDDNNSSYIKLDRHKAKMIELWNKRCELTNEHADAGRPLLRPKHVRLTLIPSVDQAINSFINSKLSNNRKKGKKGASLLDAIIFPDHVDILECIAKVNETQNLGLDKRNQEKLARQAFVQLGEHLQKVRQNDYWDTFSLDLDKGEDPAMKDCELEEKLEKNQEINKARTAQVLDEYVNKQEEARAGNKAENNDEDDEEEDDEEEEEEEEEEKVDSNNENSDLELMENGDESEDDGSIRSDGSVKSNENDNSPLVGSPETSENTHNEEANENEVHLVEDSKEETNEPEGETRSLLRIRSFAKPPETWQASQEQPVTNEDRESAESTEKSKDIETIDVTEDEKIPPASNVVEKQEKKLKTLRIDNRTVVVKPFDKNAIKVIPNFDAPKVILVSHTTVGSTKNHSSIIVQSPNNQVSNRTNINNLNNTAQAIRHKLPISPLTQPNHSSNPQQLRVSQSGGSNLQPQPLQIIHPPLQLGSLNLRPIAQKSSPQIYRLPQKLGPIVQRLANGQFVSSMQKKGSTSANGVLNPRIPQGIQIRPVLSQQQTNGSIVQNAQMSRDQLVRVRNPHYYPASAAPRTSESSQTHNPPKPIAILPAINGHGIRLAEPGNLRTVTKMPLRKTAHMQVLQLRKGQVMAKPLNPQNPVQRPQTSNQSDVCKTTITATGNNATRQPQHTVLTLRTNDNAQAKSTPTIQQQQLNRHPGNQNRWTPESRGESSKK